MLTFQRCISKNFRHLRSFSCSSAVSSKQDDKDEKNKNLSKEEVTNKLNDLLQLMIQKEDDDTKKDVNVVQAVKRKREAPEKEKPLGEKLAVAAKDVATSIGGDVGKTESELLNILLNQSGSNTQILKDVLKDIKVDRSGESQSRAEQVRQLMNRQVKQEERSVTATMKNERRVVRKKSGKEVNILEATPSSYFKDLQPQSPSCQLATWQSCLERDLRLSVTHPPANIYEQMIQWTDRGILWQFPIDNEQGMDDEKKVSFEEHILLETHLEPWCPEKGPIRHFMELVCVGLSRNYWLTAEEKRNHITWFRDYFLDKQALLKELGAGNLEIEAEKQQEVQ